MDKDKWKLRNSSTKNIRQILKSNISRFLQYQSNKVEPTWVFRYLL